MAEMNSSLLPQNFTLRSLHTALDPKSLILSQFPDSEKPQLLQLTTESFSLERGPRFKEYSDLRDRKLRMKYQKEQQTPEKELDEKAPINRSILTPPKKQVKFSSNLITPPKKATRNSIVAQSVPDFSSMLRKENRRPVAAAMPPVAERSATPPMKSGRGYGYGKVEVGSKSANSGEKKGWGWAARKSYVSVEDLKGLGAAAGYAIRGGAAAAAAGSANSKTVLGNSKTVLGNRQF